MRLYLVQHGLSGPVEGGTEKVLTEQGIEQSRLIASVAKNYAVEPQAICHSGKIRALQTAEIFQQVLQPPEGLYQLDGIAPQDDVQLFVNKIPQLQGQMIVGHLPFLDRLLSLLTCGNQEAGVYCFQNSALVCVDLNHTPDKGLHGQILWMLNPKVG